MGQETLDIWELAVELVSHRLWQLGLVPRKKGTVHTVGNYARSPRLALGGFG